MKESNKIGEGMGFFEVKEASCFTDDLLCAFTVPMKRIREKIYRTGDIGDTAQKKRYQGFFRTENGATYQIKIEANDYHDDEFRVEAETLFSNGSFERCEQAFHFLKGWDFFSCYDDGEDAGATKLKECALSLLEDCFVSCGGDPFLCMKSD